MDELEQQIRQAEAMIRGLPRERVLIFAGDGSVVFEGEGSEHEALFPASAARSRVVLHNHPSGESFSRIDVQTYFDVAAAEFRLVTARHRYRLRAARAARWRDVERSVNDLYLEEIEALADAIRRRLMTPEEGGSVLLHRVWDRIAPMFGWDYSREELP